jgi:hypothetical protein
MVNPQIFPLQMPGEDHLSMGFNGLEEKSQTHVKMPQVRKLTFESC